MFEFGEVFLLQLLVMAILSLLMYWCIYHLLSLLPQRRRRLRLRFSSKDRRQFPVQQWVSRAFLIGINPERLQEKSRLLSGCGWSIDVEQYESYRRAFILLCGCVLLLSLFFPNFVLIRLFRSPFYPMAIFSLAFILLSLDKMMLEVVRKHRSQRIIAEIFAMSHQLLYFSGSRMNLHRKIAECLPFTRTIRRPVQLMLNEWYHDAELAIRKFRDSLATEEGYSFAETLNSLRLNESEAYYDLLRERIQDYKEKLELSRDSKKETASYVLFTVAGIPILYTFQIFIYPWVMEGQKLFDALS